MNKEDLKIVFFGTPEFAVASLDRILKFGCNVVGVVTAPDKPAGRGHKLLQSAVKQYAVTHNLHLMQPERLRAPEFIDELRSLNADLFVIIAFRMLPDIVWAMPRLGTFNLHASLLPRYRGAAPINWAVINGDKETGVTTFMLSHEIDTGDVLQQARITIGDDENVGSVHDRLMALGADLTIDTIAHIITGDLKPMPQELLIGKDGITQAPKIFKETCRINWSESAENVRNLVRGLSPYPAAWTELDLGNGKLVTMKVFEVHHDPLLSDAAPGSVIINDQHLLVRCADGWVSFGDIQPAGKKRMPIDAYLRGLK
jgi:methionyl-tRNA formyltransferase